MKQKQFFLLGFIALILGTVFCLAFDINPFDASSFAGVTLATVAAVGVPVEGGTATLGTMQDADGIFDQDLSTEITKLNPSRYPLDTITRNATKKAVTSSSPEVKYFSASAKALSDTMLSTLSGDGKTAASPCRSYTREKEAEPNGRLVVYTQPSNADLWRKHDTVLMRNLTVNTDANGAMVIDGTSTTTYDVAFYVSDKMGKVIELTPLGGMKGSGANDKKFIVPDFTASTVLYRMGQAKGELAVGTDPLAIYPEPEVQYLQNFMAQVEESTFSQLQQKRVEFTLSDMERDSLDAFRAEQEMSFFFGEMLKIRDGNDTTYFTGGITRQITQLLNYGTSTAGDRTLTKAQWLRWMKTVFTRNSGSAERMLFAGSGLIEAIELMFASDNVKQSNMKVDEYLGVKVTKIYSSFGQLNIIYAPLFDESGWSDNGVILDPEFIIKRVFNGHALTAREINLKDTNQKNATAKVLQEVSGLTLRYPDAHAIIKPVA